MCLFFIGLFAAKAAGMSFQAVIPESYMDRHGIWIDDLLITHFSTIRHLQGNNTLNDYY